jgi:hypothetical protein
MYLTGSEPTRRESLADTIAVRTPASIPMIARFPNVTIPSTVIEWSLDEHFVASENVRSISNPHGNTKLEGASYSFDTERYPRRVKAMTEIQHRAIEISGSDLKADIAGMTSTLDYRSSQMVTRLLNSIDNVLLYGTGGPVTDGSSGVARKCQGLLWWAAHSGLERTAGSATTLTDPYGNTLTSGLFSVFVDFQNTAITGDSFYNNLVARIRRAGGDTSVPWVYQCGTRTMGRVAKFLMTDSGAMLNERNISADEARGVDHLVVLRLPDGSIAHFRVNHWLDAGGSTFTVNNTAYTPGTPANPGTINKTFQGDQTILAHRPGSAQVCWYREPGFKPDPYTGKDTHALAVEAEFTLKVAHPLDVAGAGNVLA